MNFINPIRDSRKTNEILELVHKVQQPIFITKDRQSDLVALSSEFSTGADDAFNPNKYLIYEVWE